MTEFLKYLLGFVTFLGIIVTMLQVEEILVDKNIISILFTVVVITAFFTAGLKLNDMHRLRIGFGLILAISILFMFHEILVHSIYQIYTENMFMIGIKELILLFMIILSVVGYMRISEYIREENK